MKTKLNNEQQSKGVGGVGGNAGYQMLQTKFAGWQKKAHPTGYPPCCHYHDASYKLQQSAAAKLNSSVANIDFPPLADNRPSPLAN